jgi:cytoskeletal protein RodZ
VAGEILKKRREELGLGVKEVAELIKIKAEYLSSIEEDRFEKLPVAVYTIGYIRCYAAYLQVDPEPILSIYSGHLSYPQPSAIFPVSSSMKKVPFSYYVIPLLVLVLIGLTVFIIMRQDDSDKQARPLPLPAQTAQTETPQPVPPVQEVLPVVPQPMQPVQNASPALPQPVQPVPGVQVQTRERVAAETGYTVEITAHDLTWVQITYSGGRSEEALLKPGMVKIWTFPETALLKLGNAGGVKLSLNGKDIGTPGGKGQVVTIALPENRQVVKESGAADRQ